MKDHYPQQATSSTFEVAYDEFSVSDVKREEHGTTDFCEAFGSSKNSIFELPRGSPNFVRPWGSLEGGIHNLDPLCALWRH